MAGRRRGCWPLLLVAGTVTLGAMVGRTRRKETGPCGSPEACSLIIDQRFNQ